MYEKERFKNRAFVGLTSSTELYIGFLLGVFVSCPALAATWLVLKVVTIFYIWSSCFLVIYGISYGYKGTLPENEE